MDMNTAVSKAARLLRLAQSDNPHEAALAAAKAQEIIERYKLTGMDLNLESTREENNEPVREFQAPLDEGGAVVATWKMRLAMAIARVNQCQVYSQGGAIKIVGRASDAEAVRYLYAFVVREVDRLTLRDAKGNGRTWANNFRIGCVETVARALNDQRDATVNAVKKEAEVSGGSAIVLVQNSLARIEKRTEETEAWVKSNLKLRSRSVRFSQDAGAREAGRKAGREISLGAKHGLGAGVRSIGSGQ